MTNGQNREEPRHYVFEAEPASLNLTGGAAGLTHAATVRTVQKSWPLLSLYVVVSMLGWVASYFTSGWVSVALSLFVSAVTFLVGWYMVRNAIVTTITIR